MPYIKIPHDIIKYKVIPLYPGIKRIDKQISLENLALINKVSQAHGFKFLLGWGTLLGAVRDSDFIEHDEDTDLLCFDSDEEILLGMIKDLLSEGFQIARWEPHRLLSITRRGEYTDFYIHHSYNEKLYICAGLPLPKEYMDNVSTIDFLGHSFNVPRDLYGVLRFWYGDNWKTPIVYNNYDLNRFTILKMKIKDWIKYHLPSCILNPIQKKIENRIFVEDYLKKGKLDGYI